MRTTLNPEEKLIFECRKHWIVLIPPFILLLLFLLFSVILLFAHRWETLGYALVITAGIVIIGFIAMYCFSQERGNASKVFGFLCIVLAGTGTSFIFVPDWEGWWIKPAGLTLILLLPTAHYIWKIIDRRVDLWAVTNQRVIDEYGILSHNAKDSVLENIHNVSFSQSLLGRMMGYGTVKVQTAADKGIKIYPLVKSPKLLKDTITRQQSLLRRASSGSSPDQNSPK